MMSIPVSTRVSLLYFRDQWNNILNEIYPLCQVKGADWVRWHEWLSSVTQASFAGPNLLELGLCWYNWQRLEDLFLQVNKLQDQQPPYPHSFMTILEQAKQKIEHQLYGMEMSEMPAAVMLPEEKTARVIGAPLENGPAGANRLVVGEEVWLEPEPDSPQDTPAIKVMTRYGQLLSFIEPQVAAELVPQWADDSLPILAVVVEQLNSSRTYPHGMAKVKFTISIKKINAAYRHNWEDLDFLAPAVSAKL